MGNMDILASKLQSLMADKDLKKPKPYDTSATVTRVEGDTVWVHIPGGVEETPVKKTINAVPGDSVMVHIENGGAWTIGNPSAPPTDDRQANIAFNVANTAQATAIDAKTESEEAMSAAEVARVSAEQAVSDAATAHEAAETAQEAAEQATAAVNTLTGRVNGLGTRVDAAESNISDIETELDTIDGTVSDLGTRVTTAEGKVATAESNVAALTTRVTTAEGNISDVEDDISTLQSDVSTAQGNITTIEGNLTNLGNRVTTAEGTVTNLTGRVETAEGNISDIEDDIDTINGSVTNLGTRVTTAEGKVATAESNVAALTTRVATAESDISDVETDIDGLQTRVTDAESDIDDTLEGLALAQNVIGTVAWLTAHATATTDTTPVSGKTYYIRHQDGTFSVVTDTTGKNPAQEGWYEMDEAVSNYVASHLALTNDGLYVTGDGSDWKVLIADDGIYIVDSSGISDRIVSEYSDDVTIGDASAGHVVIDYHSLQGVGIDNEKYFEVMDARNQSGVASIVETHETGDYGFSGLNFRCDDVREITSVKVDNVETSDYTIRYDQENKITGIEFNDPVGPHITIEAELVTGEMVAALTFGSRNTMEGLVGQYSVSEGVDNVASGYASHAEGYAAHAIGAASHAEGYGYAEGDASHAEGSGAAIGRNSHAEGYDTGAVGVCSHAEGMETHATSDESHAEGFLTYATGGASHTEGRNTTAGGDYSHAQNEGTIAAKMAQTALGTSNIEDTNSLTTHPSGYAGYGKYAVIVGNGYYDGQADKLIRSNALTVDWRGSVDCYAITARDEIYAFGDIMDHAGNVLSNKVDAADLAAVATSGDYTDLSNKPTIPTVPTNVSAFTNDAGYLTTETDPTVPTWAKAASKPSYTASEVGALPSTTQIPSATSDLTNDSGFMNASAILDMFYPVGCYYHTSDGNFNPNTAWGGTWSLLGEGQVLLSAGSNYAAGQTYGNNSPTLTDDQISHGHTASGGAVNDHAATACSRTTNVALTNNTGGHAVSVTWPTYSGPSHSHSVASDSNYFLTTVKSPDKAVGRRSIKPGTGTAVTNNLYCDNAIGRNATTDAAGTGNCTRSGGSVSVSAHGITQPEFKTPVLMHTVTQPTISDVGSSTRASYSTMQSSTAAYIWHRTA